MVYCKRKLVTDDESTVTSQNAFTSLRSVISIPSSSRRSQSSKGSGRRRSSIASFFSSGTMGEVDTIATTADLVASVDLKPIAAPNVQKLDNYWALWQFFKRANDSLMPLSSVDILRRVEDIKDTQKKIETLLIAQMHFSGSKTASKSYVTATLQEAKIYTDTKIKNSYDKLKSQISSSAESSAQVTHSLQLVTKKLENLEKVTSKVGTAKIDDFEKRFAILNSEFVAFKNESSASFGTFRNETNDKFASIINETDARWSVIKKESEERIVAAKKESEEKIVAFKKESDEKIVAFKKESDEKIVAVKKESEDKFVAYKKESNDKFVTLKNESEDKLAALQNEFKKSLVTLQHKGTSSTSIDVEKLNELEERLCEIDSEKNLKIAELNSSINSLNSTVNDLREAQNSLLSDVKKKLKNVNVEATQRTEKDLDVENITEQLASLQEENQNLKSTVEAVEVNGKEWTKHIADFSKQLNSLQNHSSELSEYVSHNEKLFNQLQDLIREDRDHLIMLQRRLEEMENTAASLKAEKQDLKKYIKKVVNKSLDAQRNNQLSTNNNFEQYSEANYAEPTSELQENTAALSDNIEPEELTFKSRTFSTRKPLENNFNKESNCSSEPGSPSFQKPSISSQPSVLPRLPELKLSPQSLSRLRSPPTSEPSSPQEQKVISYHEEISPKQSESSSNELILKKTSSKQYFDSKQDFDSKQILKKISSQTSSSPVALPLDAETETASVPATPKIKEAEAEFYSSALKSPIDDNLSGEATEKFQTLTEMKESLICRHISLEEAGVAQIIRERSFKKSNSHYSLKSNEMRSMEFTAMKMAEPNEDYAIESKMVVLSTKPQNSEQTLEPNNDQIVAEVKKQAEIQKVSNYDDDTELEVRSSEEMQIKLLIEEEKKLIKAAKEKQQLETSVKVTKEEKKSRKKKKESSDPGAAILKDTLDEIKETNREVQDDEYYFAQFDEIGFDTIASETDNSAKVVKKVRKKVKKVKKKAKRS